MPRFINEANAEKGKPCNNPAFQSMPRFINEANRGQFGRYRKFVIVSIHASLHQRGKPVKNFTGLSVFGEVSIHASLHQRGKPAIAAIFNRNLPSFNPCLASSTR